LPKNPGTPIFHLQIGKGIPIFLKILAKLEMKKIGPYNISKGPNTWRFPPYYYENA